MSELKLLKFQNLTMGVLININNANSAILTRLSISPDNWLILTTQFEHHFKSAVGSPDSISKYCQNQKLKRRQDINNSQLLFASS